MGLGVGLMLPTDPVEDKDLLEARWLHQAMVNDRRRRQRHIWLLVVGGVPVLAAVIVALDMILQVL